jgi:hypothetical protein
MLGLPTVVINGDSDCTHRSALIAITEPRYDMATVDAHPLVGPWAPDMALHTGTGTVRLAKLTRKWT